MGRGRRGTTLVLACWLVSTTALAQGTLRGVVTDSLLGERLPGAHVYLPGTALGSATDLEGAYRIGGVPAGRHTVRVSYLGYRTAELPVDVVDGRTTVLDVRLLPGVIEGEVVVITGQAEGQAAAINQQLTANTIVNVISEEKIQELPDANAAEAIGRLPGVALQRSGGEANKVILRGLSDRFSSITVDGVRIAATDADGRGVDLSTISQGSLAGIELYKALTPDRDADAIAGSVNLVTKKAPAERLLRLDAQGAYTDLSGALNQYDFVLRYGDRFLRDRLGVQVSANLEQRDRSKENLDLEYDIRGLADGGDYEITDFTLNFTDETRRRGGASLLLDLDTPDGGSVRLNNIYNRTKRDFIAFERNYPTGEDELFYSARDREQEIYTLNSFLSGEHYLLGLAADWGASYARSVSDFPFDFDLSFTEPSSTDAQGTPVSSMRPIPANLLKGPPEALIPFALNNFERAYLYAAYFRGQESRDVERTAFLNLSRPYTLGSRFSGTLKLGGKYRHKARSREQSELLSPYYNEPFPQFVRQADGTVVSKDLGNTPFESLETVGTRILVTNFLDETPQGRDVYGAYRLYPMIDRDALRRWWELNQNGFSDAGGVNPEYERNLEADALYYRIEERVSAAYVMNTFDVGRRVSLIAGVRVEREDNDYASRYALGTLGGFPVPRGTIRDTTAAHRETVWLPNVHLTIRPTDFLNVRLAAYKALARPSFNHRLPSVVTRAGGTFYPGNSLYLGNPALRAAEAWNYEVNTAFYGDRIGLFSVSAFYKDVEGMYHVFDGLPFTGQAIFDSLGIDYRDRFNGVPYALTYPYNAATPTRIWGLEVEHQTSFRYLPGLLKHVVLSYNVSVVRSETYIPSTRIETFFVQVPGIPFPVERARSVLTESRQKLEGQPELFGNVALGYDIGGFSARLSLFHQDAYNQRFSPDGRSDAVVQGFTRLDLALKHRLTEHVSVLLNLNNLTNVEEGTAVLNRVEGWNLLNTSELYGLTADFGLRITF